MRPNYQLAALGKYYGFPECCVEEFLNTACRSTKEQYPEGPWRGSGFVPCADCAEKALHFDNFVAANITPYRVCSAPFPDEGPDAQMEAIIRRAIAGRIPYYLFLPVRLVQNYVAAQ